MPAPTITITSPTANSTVSRLIGVAGHYTSDDPNVSISVVLKDSTGTPVASTSGMGFAGNWTAFLTAPQAYTGASITASIVGTSASDTVGGITVT